jgi:TonB family protein
MTAIAHALSLALLHFVWQGMLVVSLLWTVLIGMRKRSSNARYVASCVALAVLALLPAITAYEIYEHPAPAVGHQLAATSVQIAPSALPQSANLLIPLQSWAVPVWCAGVLLFSLRLVYGSTRVAALRKHGEPAEETLLTVISILATSMGVKQRFGVLISKLADGPGVAGIVRPVILLPAATLLGLSQEQLEAVLAHELAHIRRYDYLVNITQMLIEALLFYHPAVWWISARVRRERELCCDDEAVRMCGDSLSYARALTTLERLRMTTPDLALGATDGLLSYRVKRLLGVADEESLPSKLPALVALCLALAGLSVSINRVHGQAVQDAPGVKVDLGSSPVIHRNPVEYPVAARTKSLEGTVQVEVRLDNDGNVSDARVLSGPDEFRKTVLQSVLDWHFPPAAAGSTKVVNVEFQTPLQKLATVKLPEAGLEESGVRKDVESTTQFLKAEIQQLQGNLEQLQTDHLTNQESIKAREAEILTSKLELDALKLKLQTAQGAQELVPKKVGPLPQSLEGRIVRSIRANGLGISLADFLAQAQLPVHEGDILTPGLAKATVAAVKKFDEHLNVLWTTPVGDPNGVEINIVAPGAKVRTTGPDGAGLGGGIGSGFGGGVPLSNLIPDAARTADAGVAPPVPIYQPAPEYTDEAKKAKWQGSVILAVLVDETGKVTEVSVVRSLGVGLDQKAIEAVRQWQFKPGTKDGKPVPVHANIEMNFRLP